MEDENKKESSNKSDLFWKSVALIGTLASVAGVIIAIIK